MNTRIFVDEFLNSDFAKKNLYTHLQAGYPLPIQRNNVLAIKLLFHPLICTLQQITLSEPIFEIVLEYPTARILYFSQLEPQNNTQIVIPQQKVQYFANSFEQAFNNCDELLQFFETYNRITPIVFKQYYEQLNTAITDTGLAVWYGGIYDSLSSI